MNSRFVSVGFGNMVNVDKIVSIVTPDTAPGKRLISDARESNRLIDATCARRAKAIVILETGQLVLCGLNTETIAARINSESDINDDNEEN